MNVMIRQVKVHETRAVATFLMNYFKQSFRYFTRDETRLIYLFSKSMTYEQCFIATIDEEIVGLITYSTNERASFEISLNDLKKELGLYKTMLFYFLTMKKALPLNSEQICLNSLAVHRNYRRQGIATQLVRFVMDQTQAKEYVLQVMTSNKDAFQLYRQLGFESVKKIENRVLTCFHRETVLLMRCLIR